MRGLQDVYCYTQMGCGLVSHEAVCWLRVGEYSFLGMSREIS